MNDYKITKCILRVPELGGGKTSNPKNEMGLSGINIRKRIGIEQVYQFRRPIYRRKHGGCIERQSTISFYGLQSIALFTDAGLKAYVGKGKFYYD